MENTKGFFTWVGSVLTSLFSAAEVNGIKLKEDYPKFIGPLIRINEAFGVTKFKQEAGADIEQRKGLFEAMLTSIDSGDQRRDYNIASILNGIYAGYNEGVQDGKEQGKAEGIEIGRQQVIADLTSGKLKIQGLQIVK